MPPLSPDPTPPTTASLKAWWKHFTIVQKKPPTSSSTGMYTRPHSALSLEISFLFPHLSHNYRLRYTLFGPLPSLCDLPGAVFGVPLRQSLRYASVQIFTANQNNTLYVWGYIPVVVAKCGLFLKENGTEVEGIFRVSGSTRRMRELQNLFETPPRYGKNIVWKDLTYTPHDVASIFRRFITSMPEPIIPHSLYHDFRNVYSRKPFNEEEAIGAYKRLIGQLPLANQYLLLYVLDLLTVFAKKSEKNMMPAANLAVIFRPAVLNHPAHEMSHEHHKLSQEVLEFLIKHQDWFMLDIPPPPRSDSLVTSANNAKSSSSKSRNPFSISRVEKPGSTTKPNEVTASSSAAAAAALADELNMYVGPVSDDDEADRGWRLAGSVGGSATVGRRRTFSERGSPRPFHEEHGRSTGDARRSEENVTSSSAPTHTASPFRSVAQLTPVREASGGDINTLVADHTLEGSAATGTTAPVSAEQTAAVASAAGVAGIRLDTAVSSSEGGGDSSSVREKRAKFDDDKLAKNEEVRRDAEKEKERRGRSGTKGGGLWGSVRRARTVEGTVNAFASGAKTPPERHVLKKRNSKSDVDKVER